MPRPLTSACFAGALLLAILAASFVAISPTLLASGEEKEAPKEPVDHTPAEPPPLPPDPPEPVIARLGELPDWSELDRFQHTITREDFQYLLNHCYAQKEDAYDGYIEIDGNRARILRQSNHKGSGYYDLYFLTDRRKRTDVERYWTTPWELPTVKTANRPLEGVHIAIDAGHIGGEFARLEGRFYTIGDYTAPILEGEMALRVAEILRRDLGLLGAKISLVRKDNAPVTDQRPEDLMDEAEEWLKSSGKLAPRSLVEQTASRLFYVSSEIRSRAELVNNEIKPDLVLCLHFNAEPWSNPYKPSFSKRNHLHLILNGCYSAGEIAEDDERFEMLKRLLQRVYYYEVAMSGEIADRMLDETRLEQFGYSGKSGKSVSDNNLVWARNLLANRIYECPVVFFEPYVMNNREVHARVQAGEYSGLKEFNGVAKKNIFQEYADGITSGLVNYFRRVRGLEK